MTGRTTITDRRVIEAALDEPRLVPHGTSDPSSGSTMALRSRMARFSGPDEHLARRAQVDAAIAPLDVNEAQRLAHAITLDVVSAGETTVDAVVRAVPTMTVVDLLGLRIDPRDAVDDVETIVRVIGRGEPADAASDAATGRLLAAVPASVDPVAVVSLLYQNFDATAALVRTTLEARRTGRDPEPAVRVTRRVAVAPVDIDGLSLDVSDEVVLEIGPAGLPFGSGPHACPGRDLAEAIVLGLVSALDERSSGS